MSFLLIIDVAGPIVLGKKKMVEVKPANEIRYNNELRAGFKDRVWQGCRSYYQDEHGRNVVLYPWHSYVMYFQIHFYSLKVWTHH